MSIQITIIGLGQIGASVGLALGERSQALVRVGHDKDHQVAREAKKLGAVDKVHINLFQSVKDADLVLLATPLDQIHETLTLIANDLKEDVVVMDTGPVKSVVAEWARELLPAGRHYVGLTPVINPQYLHGMESGIAAARADLFKDGLIAIIPPAETNSAAVKMAVDLTALIGSTPLFADALEVDSIMAATHLLPQLLASALLNVTVDEPGWSDGQKFAGRAYALMTGPMSLIESPDAVIRACLQNRDNTARMIERLVDGLQVLQERIAAGDEEMLVAHFKHIGRLRQDWWAQRQAAEWEARSVEAGDLPSAREMFGRMIFGDRRSRDKK